MIRMKLPRSTTVNAAVAVKSETSGDLVCCMEALSVALVGSAAVVAGSHLIWVGFAPSPDPPGAPVFVGLTKSRVGGLAADFTANLQAVLADATPVEAGAGQVLLALGASLGAAVIDWLLVAPLLAIGCVPSFGGEPVARLALVLQAILGGAHLAEARKREILPAAVTNLCTIAFGHRLSPSLAPGDKWAPGR